MSAQIGKVFQPLVHSPFTKVFVSQASPRMLADGLIAGIVHWF